MMNFIIRTHTHVRTNKSMKSADEKLLFFVCCCCSLHVRCETFRACNWYFSSPRLALFFLLQLVKGIGIKLHTHICSDDPKKRFHWMDSLELLFFGLIGLRPRHLTIWSTWSVRLCVKCLFKCIHCSHSIMLFEFRLPLGWHQASC